MKETLIKILIALNIMQPTPKEEVIQDTNYKMDLEVIESNKVMYSEQFNDEFYGQAEYGKDYYEEITMGNENGNKLYITIDTWKDIYTMEYEKPSIPSINIAYHYHSIQDLNNDIKTHQQHLYENFKDWEELEGLQLPRDTMPTDFDIKGRKLRVNAILRIDEIENDGWGYYVDSTNSWYQMTVNDIESAMYRREQNILELKMYNGFDIVNNIDYELILGKDWKCLIHTEEGKNRVEEYLSN